MGRPMPDYWGLPAASYNLGGSCPASHFGNMMMIINTDFCGDWAGDAGSWNDYGRGGCQKSTGYGSCKSYVQNQPRAFSNAYWEINYIRAYKKKKFLNETKSVNNI